MSSTITVKKATTVKDVDQHEFVKAFAQFLKKSGKLKVPDWVDLVKTSKAKELAPYDEDWFYTRCASLARHMYIRSPVGTNTVTKIFGTRKRNGSAPSHFCKGSGSVARKALQALEGMKIVEKVPEGSGRRLTGTGRRDLDRIATQMKRKPSVLN